MKIGTNKCLLEKQQLRQVSATDKAMRNATVMDHAHPTGANVAKIGCCAIHIVIHVMRNAKTNMFNLKRYFTLDGLGKQRLFVYVERYNILEA